MIRRWMDWDPRYKKVVFLIATTLLLLVVATLGFMYFEQLSPFNAFWMTIISVMTIGYGDIYPTTEEGRWFALLLVPAGAGIVTYGLGVGATYFIERQLSDRVWVRGMEKQIANLKDHVIICGSGRVAQQAYKQLMEEKSVEILFIYTNEQELVETIEPGTLRIVGDPTDKAVLRRARVSQARALIAALPSDADNVFITLTAKSMNEEINIAARSEKDGSEEILEKAGATSVINPSIIGGRELAMSVVKPKSTDYINDLIRSEKKEFMVGEIVLDEAEPIIGMTIEDANLRKGYDITLVAILRNDELLSNPELSESFRSGDTLIVIGAPDKIEHFRVNKSKGHTHQ